MGWRGALRSYQAAVRRAEREAERSARARERAFKQRLKEEEVRRAAAAVATQAELLEALTTIHQESLPPVDWAEVLQAQAPPAPAHVRARQEAARRALDNFRPGWLRRIFGGARKRAQLEMALARAEEAEEAEYQARLRAHREAIEEHAALRAIAERIVAGDHGAYEDAIREFRDELLAPIQGKSVEFRLFSSNQAVVEFECHSPDIIPAERLTQLKNGKLSSRPFTKTDYHKLYSDYVASSAFRLARDLMAILPLDRVFVNAKTPLLDASSGHLVAQCVLCVEVPRESLHQIGWENVDPTLALEKFRNASGFRKARPVQPVAPLLDA